MIIALNEKQARRELEDRQHEIWRETTDPREEWYPKDEDEDEDLDFDADWCSEEFDEDYYTDYPEYFYGEDVEDYYYPDSDLWDEWR